MHENKFAFGLLLLYIILAASAVVQKSVTVDEVIHIPAGYSYLVTGDFRLNPEHPPLMKLLAGLFLLPFQPSVPLDHPTWEAKDQEEFGRLFLFEYNTARHDVLLFFARLPMILVGALLGVFIYLWAAELYGKKGGVCALAAYVLSPNFLGHGSLVTTDVGVASFLTGSLFVVWKWLKHQEVKKKKRNILLIILAGVLFGLTLGAKFTGIFLVPLVGLMFILHCVQNKKQKKEFVQRAGIILIMFVIGGVVLASLYGFKDASTYAKGLRMVVEQSKEGRNSFLFGEYGRYWWYYFPLVFMIKTPIPTMVLFLLAMGFLYKTKKAWFDEVGVFVPFVVLFGLFMLNKMNIGFRHVFPALPFLFILTGRITKYKFMWKKQNVLRFLQYGLLVWLAGETLFIHPDFLAYFNEFSGGPLQAYKYVIDSNIDWGQDLKGVKPWMEKNKVEKVTLGYFGKDDPDFRGISHQKLKCYPTTGYVIVSVNILNGFRHEDYVCTEWLRKYSPIDTIGYSLLVYKINETKDKDVAIQEYCTKGCSIRCEKEGQHLKEALVLNKKCHCGCSFSSSAEPHTRNYTTT